MNYLITGATGFIGSKVVDRLLASGHSVNYLGRRRSARLDGRAAFHQWDGVSEPPLNSVPRFDAVVHLAGEPVAQRWTSEVKKRIFESRATLTHKLVSGLAQLKHKPAVFISASAIGYYGNRGDEILTEHSEPGSGFLAEVCVAWEKEALRAQEFGLRVAVPRISTVLGKEGGALPKMARPFRLGIGGKFGDGRHWMSWIHVEDLTELILFAATNDAVSGTLNATSPEPVTNALFTRELAAVLHRPAIFSVPRFALRLTLGEMADVLFDSLRVVPQRAESLGFQFRYPRLKETLQNVLS